MSPSRRKYLAKNKGLVEEPKDFNTTLYFIRTQLNSPERELALQAIKDQDNLHRLLERRENAADAIMQGFCWSDTKQENWLDIHAALKCGRYVLKTVHRSLRHKKQIA